MNNILQIRKLYAGYDNKVIINGVSLSAKKGEITVIMGPNGCGKSTLLKSIYNLCKIYSGNIIYNNQNITKISTEDLISKRICYIPQARLLFKNLTVRENLDLAAFYTQSTDHKSINKVYDMFNFLKKRENEYAFNLSGGQQQILSISMALVQNPDLMLLDEPSLGLSPKTTAQVFEIIKNINKLGISIILIEQNIKQALNVAHKCYILKNGMVYDKGDYKTLNERNLLFSYFSISS